MKIVFYHSPCLDGLVAAWAVSQAFPDARLVPLTHGERIAQWVEGHEVLFVDIIPCREDLERCIYAAESVTILDHHTTAYRDIESWLVDGMSSIFEIVYDPNKSGAGLAWDCFHKEERPWLVNYVQDQDLGKHVLPNCKDVISYISDVLNRAPNVETVSETLNLGFERVVAAGKTIRENREALIEDYIRSAKLYKLPGLSEPVPGVECPRTVVSDVLNALAVGHVLAFAWREGPKGGIAYSFRNTHDGIDLSEWVPKVFGTGGGHPHASGLTTTNLIHEEL